MRWPIAIMKRSSLETIFRNFDHEADRRRQAETLNRSLEQERNAALLNCAKIAQDLRMLRIQLEHNPHGHDRIQLSIEFSSHAIAQSYRYNGTFHDMIAMQVERMFYQLPEMREVLTQEVRW